MATFQEKKAEAIANQLAAAHCDAPAVRLVAGPGSGKSHTITERVLHLLRADVPPSEIAVVSFTNASTEDLRARILPACMKSGFADGPAIRISTLHSLALKMLKMAGRLGTFIVKPQVLDRWELDNIFDHEFSATFGETKFKRIQEIRRFHEAKWATGVTDANTYVQPDPPVTVAELANFDNFHPPTSRLYCCVLPGEIIRMLVDEVTQGAMTIPASVRIRHLIVDEFQDLSVCDQEFIQILVKAGAHLFVAGDDDQSVYSFRHAAPTGIRDFESRHPVVKSFTLKHCFRCTPDILAGALSLVGKTPEARIPKDLESMPGYLDPVPQGLIDIRVFPDGAAEADAIANNCKNLIAAGVDAHQIMILVGSTRQNAPVWGILRQALDDHSVPYAIRDVEPFSDTAPGRLLLALLRILATVGDPDELDFLAARTIFGLLPGVGIGTALKLKAYLQGTVNASMRSAFFSEMPISSGVAKLDQAIGKVRDAVAELKLLPESPTVVQAASEIVGIVRNLMGDGASSVVRDWFQAFPVDTPLAKATSVLRSDSELERENLMAAILKEHDLEESTPRASPRIRVMTMHGAKGLAAEYVFIPGLEHGIFPNRRQVESAYLYEEARRLLYVSMTRAKMVCLLSGANRRLVNGRYESQVTSAFLTECGIGLSQGAAILSEAGIARFRTETEWYGAMGS